MNKQKAAFLIDEETWKKFRIITLEKKTTATNLLVEFIEKYIEKNEKNKND
mgnify:CR=1 FL=1